MPIADGGSATKPKPPRRTPIFTAPTALGMTGPTTSTTTSSSSTTAPKTGGKNLGTGTRSVSGSASGSSSSSSSSSSTGYDYAKEQAKRDRAAAQRHITDADSLGGQIAALQNSLGKSGLNGTFRRALRQRLQNIKLVRNEQLAILEEGYEDRSNSLDADAKNNETAAADSSGLNEVNRVRERNSAISEAMSQGAGESDTLRAQLMSLRSWDANQDGINRAFADGQRSINNSRIDLATDTKTGMANVWTEANADKEQLWTNFYNQTSETQVALGNAYGQQAEHLGLAIEANGNAAGAGGKPSKTTLKSSSSSSSKSSKKDDKGKGRTAVVLGSRDRDRELLEVGGPDDGRPVASATRGFNARPVPTVTGVGGPDGGRPTADGGRVPRDWDKAPNLGKGKPGRPGKGKGGKGGGGLRGRQQETTELSDEAMMDASKTQGKVWDNPGLPDHLKNWEGRPLDNARLANSVFVPNMGSGGMAQMKAPEGATLRKW